MSSLLMLAVLFTAAISGQMVSQSERLYQAAHHKEVTERDLRGAIEEYKKVAASGDRALAAKALLRMAECYQKLGDAQSRQIYEQIVREYADQKDAVTLARTRLGQTGTSDSQRTLSLRKVLDDSLHSVSGDGRYVLDGPNIRDTSTGEMTRWWSASENGSPGLGRAVSKDGAQIAYEWCTGFQICELRGVSVRDGSVQTPRRLFASTEVRLHPEDWSPDGRWIAVNGVGVDGTGQIGVVSAQSGDLRRLKSTDWRGSTGLFFSPDGESLAFDLPVTSNNDRRDVFVMAVDASREIAAVVSPADDRVMGWSPDGRYLLFTSDRSGTRDLWAVPFSKGRPEGRPTRLQPNLAVGRSLGVTRSGALYLVTSADERDVEVRSIDLSTAQTGPAVRLPEPFSGANIEPAWSADSKFLAFVSGERDGTVFAISTVATGEVREVRPQPALAWYLGLNWSPDGQSIAVTGVDVKGRLGIFRVDVHTGALSAIHVPVPLNYQGPFWSPDGKRIFYRSGFRGPILERDIDSGNERVVLSENALGPNQNSFGPFSLSPDGRWIGTYRDPQSLVIVPVAGGEPREVLRISNSSFDTTIPMTWTPDSGAVLVRQLSSEYRRPDGPTNGGDLWIVPINGDAPKKVSGDFSQAINGQLGKIRLSPDGKQLAYVAGKSYRKETWVLENFLPAQKAAK